MSQTHSHDLPCLPRPPTRLPGRPNKPIKHRRFRKRVLHYSLCTMHFFRRTDRESTPLPLPRALTRTTAIVFLVSLLRERTIRTCAMAGADVAGILPDPLELLSASEQQIPPTIASPLLCRVSRIWWSFVTIMYGNDAVCARYEKPLQINPRRVR